MGKDKRFQDLTYTEARQIIRHILISSESEGEVKRRLTEAGFDGGAAGVTLNRSGNYNTAMAVVHGPKGRIIKVL